uniref:C-type lectin domain family 7 member A-like isoform X2 n=1 Tax=Monopterus albus TaxID=43700 RepID=UPI0009B41A3C|nr:C-type lectin domain family 7 member A-like isoform X2 [Monopterus albus]
MEKELNYATVVFSDGRKPPKEKNEEPTIYSTIRHEGPNDTVPNGEAAANCQRFHLLAVCLGTLCVLLVASITAIICTTVVMNKQCENFEANLSNLSNLTAKNQQLMLEKQIQDFYKNMNNLTRMLEFILKFDTFPVNTYCPNKVCQPCQKDWILFQDKCYLFYNKNSNWKTWDQSRAYCQTFFADLVVIDSLQEQEFISNHTQSYYDQYHGYWLGLQQTSDKNWLWVDGTNDTLRYWMKDTSSVSSLYALMIPGKNITASWDPADSKMQNKFICEDNVLIKFS